MFIRHEQEYKLMMIMVPQAFCPLDLEYILYHPNLLAASEAAE